MSDNMNVIVIGAGYMGKEHSKVLLTLGITPTVVCRSQESADKFEKEIGIRPLIGGVNNALQKIKSFPTHAIVAVNVDQLASTTMLLANAGIKKMLVEKPVALNMDELKEVVSVAEKTGTDIYVAYNRRFYASTDKAIEIIKADGGVSSFNFEFTEWGYKIEASKHPQPVKDGWLKANSSHVIDLAFFLGGEPEEISSYAAGTLPWHSSASRYAGAGRTKAGALFSYQADWDAPGRWAVEILTNNHRLYLRPLEKLSIQNKGSVNIETVEIDDSLDVKFKPGLHNQARAFLFGEKKERLATIGAQVKHMSFFETIEQGK